MKIVFITPWYPDEKYPNSGVFIRTQAKALATKHEVIVVSAKVYNRSFALSKYTLTETRESNLTEHRLMIHRSLPIINQFHHLFITWRVAKQLLENTDVDVIHSFIGYPGAILGWLLSRSLAVPFIHTEHTRLSNNYRSIFHKKLTRFGMLRASRLTAVSSWLANELKNETKKKIVVIPNMIEVNRFKLSELLPKDIIHLGFLGGMNTDVKGLDILINALSFCSFTFHLHIGGDGKLLEGYKAFAKQVGIEDQCSFYGFVQYEEVPSFYNKLHFFVCSSRYETFNVSIVEAMASGLPVLSTKCGGPEETITSTTGFLVENENAKALAEGLKKMAQEFDSYSCENIRLHVVNNFSTESLVVRYEELYQSAIHC
jgi:L-malate glycosyltransferase